jgi:hypothetical protein
LLAVAAELAGASEQQDERIATMFQEDHPGRLFRRHLDDALASDLAVRSIAKHWLLAMWVRSKAEPLRKEIEKIVPGLERGLEQSGSGEIESPL